MRDEIVIQVGKFLERHEFVTPSNIQRQILYESDKREVVPIEEIVETLDFLVLSGFLFVYKGEEKNTCTYARFFSPMIQKQLAKSGLFVYNYFKEMEKIENDRGTKDFSFYLCEAW